MGLLCKIGIHRRWRRCLREIEDHACGYGYHHRICIDCGVRWTHWDWDL